MPIGSDKGSFIKPGFDPLAVQTTVTEQILWTWGTNNAGQLGLGNTTNYSSPVQVGALNTWAEISAGINFSLSVTDEGELWTWGYNAQGQLGTNNTTNYSSPVQVGALTTWSKLLRGITTALQLKQTALSGVLDITLRAN